MRVQTCLHQWSWSREHSDDNNKSQQGETASKWTAEVWKDMNGRDGLMLCAHLNGVKGVGKRYPSKKDRFLGRAKYCLFYLYRHWIVNSWKAFCPIENVYLWSGDYCLLSGVCFCWLRRCTEVLDRWINCCLSRNCSSTWLKSDTVDFAFLFVYKFSKHDQTCSLVNWRQSQASRFHCFQSLC